MQHPVDNWTGGQVRFFWLTTLPHFPLFVKRLTLIVSPRCECRRDMRWNTATGKVTQISQRQRKTKKQIKRKPRKKQLFQTRLQAQRKDKPPPGECELYLDVDCSNLSYNSRPSATVLRFQDLWLFLKYQTWKPGVRQYFKVWYTIQSCWRLEETAAAAGSRATGLWQDRVLPGWWQQVHLSYLAVTYLIWSGKSGHLPPLQVGRQDNQRGRADWGLLQRCWLLQLWVWTTSGKLSMMILIDFKTFDDDSCKLDFENPGIATSCCCSISATDSKDQLKQTSTLCRG